MVRDLTVAERTVRLLPEAVHTAPAAAAALGIEVGQIANSLIFNADGHPLLVLTSGAHRVDTAKVARYQARFAGVFFPGETMVTSYWRDGDTILIDAKSKERGASIISNAAITVR